MAYVITEPCIGVRDRACMDVCPCDCIFEATAGARFPEMLFIDPDDCIDCGVCQPECPVDAIYPDVDVPEEWARFVRMNVEATRNLA